MLEPMKSRDSVAVQDIDEQGAKTILLQTGRARKRRLGQQSNISFAKQPRLCSELYYMPNRWTRNDDSSGDGKSDNEIFETSDDKH